MQKETRAIIHDDVLGLAACRFQGMRCPFPNHFHEHYVIGLVEGGKRLLSCKNCESPLLPGHLLLLNPGDSHACVQRDDCAMDYRALNIPESVMLNMSREITGDPDAPAFSPNVVFDVEAAASLHDYHESLTGGANELERRERLFTLLERLIHKYGNVPDFHLPKCHDAIHKARTFMERSYAERIRLEDICECAGLSKSTLLRAFVKTVGVTPYSYLQNIRIWEAKKLLAKGVSPARAALAAGFADQSHFTHYFTRFIGLTPGAYQDIFRPEIRKSHEK